VPYYIIEEQTKDAPILHPVKAKNQAKALAAIVQPKFKVRSAETEELLKLSQSGVKVIEA
jgi:hypothetical protein